MHPYNLNSLKKKEKKKHKKQRRDEKESNEDSPGSSEPSEGWPNPPSQAHILRPLYMICVRPTYGNVIKTKPCAIGIQPSPVMPIAKVVPPPLSASALASLEPDEVNHRPLPRLRLRQTRGPWRPGAMGIRARHAPR
ncbi:hypothetical protein PGTUg99_010211 [Puccinia graminis f. sp. tritici]|uniref:Uncharacterized protein n=1 Tax=Puccinia graminis f. sp. tritici TaxID=56615 RepID=A0A5B0LHW6_PUCGR|nr:hypothetical protein PGTUg99_010211 [Puccinia graminis f. sp. tritici]